MAPQQPDSVLDELDVLNVSVGQTFSWWRCCGPVYRHIIEPGGEGY